jgi:hypothetical protein
MDAAEYKDYSDYSFGMLFMEPARRSKEAQGYVGQAFAEIGLGLGAAPGSSRQPRRAA